ncbi:hypothetical protein [Microcoleus sp. D2_18a_D3]
MRKIGKFLCGVYSKSGVELSSLSIDTTGDRKDNLSRLDSKIG